MHIFFEGIKKESARILNPCLEKGVDKRDIYKIFFFFAIIKSKFCRTLCIGFHSSQQQARNVMLLLSPPIEMSSGLFNNSSSAPSLLYSGDNENCSVEKVNPGTNIIVVHVYLFFAYCVL